MAAPALNKNAAAGLILAIDSCMRSAEAALVLGGEADACRFTRLAFQLAELFEDASAALEQDAVKWAKAQANGEPDQMSMDI